MNPFEITLQTDKMTTLPLAQNKKICRDGKLFCFN